MTTPRYIVHYHCHVCGQMHLVLLELPLPGGPTEPCTLPEHDPDEAPGLCCARNTSWEALDLNYELVSAADDVP